jgi:hypothetical protein
MAKQYIIRITGEGCKCDITESLHQVIQAINEAEPLSSHEWEGATLDTVITEVPDNQPTELNSGI